MPARSSSRASRSLSRPSHARVERRHGELLHLRFHIVDEDKNNYLNRKEFAALGLPGADFAAVDANGDGQIVEEELSAFLNKKGNVYLNQVVLGIADESPSLFEFLDTRPDGRLSPRELNAAPERLRALDRNADGNLTLGELRTQISIDAEVKRPADNRRGMLVLRRRQQSGATPAPATWVRNGSAGWTAISTATCRGGSSWVRDRSSTGWTPTTTAC